MRSSTSPSIRGRTRGVRGPGLHRRFEARPHRDSCQSPSAFTGSIERQPEVRQTAAYDYRGVMHTSGKAMASATVMGTIPKVAHQLPLTERCA
jgi:hypothetical protein